MKKLILIGDSIRIGYQSTVMQELEGVAEMFSPEQNGGTSQRVLDNLEDWVISQSPDIVHLNAGLHDLARERDADGPRVSLDEYEANLRRIFQAIKEGGSTLIWATTTPVNEENHRERKPFDRFEDDVRAYNKVALRVANELEVPVNDLYRVIEEAGKDDLLLPDGVHFTPEAYALLGRKVAARVREYL